MKEQKKASNDAFTLILAKLLPLANLPKNTGYSPGDYTSISTSIMPFSLP
jgi:hypothetical protein